MLKKSPVNHISKKNHKHIHGISLIQIFEFSTKIFAQKDFNYNNFSLKSLMTLLSFPFY